MVGVCYKPPHQEDGVDEILYRQLAAASHLQTLVLIGDFNHRGICWRDNMSGHEQFQGFLNVSMATSLYK